MQEIFGSVRRSLVFRTPSADDGATFGGLVEKIGSTIRKSRIGLFSKPSLPAPPPASKADTPQIRWRKGELIGCGAFGRVYMGMNLDSGELLAVKQVSIAANSASKERTQAHVLELEDEVKLLKNLSHPNIVRYLGTAREEESLNILLEFVPGGSISSLLGKFGSFPESVIKMYTNQLLLGLEYLHNNGIMHRDIKGANILVDNKGCIKLADFGASKKVVELATINGAKSMKGTPYWMAPEVILQTGHSFSADIWSVGCTVIEMATGKPPWSQQYQEVAALFHIGTTKAHPPIPEHLTAEARDFLLKCLQKEPNLRPSASDLLQHPFVLRENRDSVPVLCTSIMEPGSQMATSRLNNMENSVIRSSYMGLKDVCEMGSMGCSSIPFEKELTGSHWKSSNFEDDMCQIDDEDELMIGFSTQHKSVTPYNDLNKSFNPMSEPTDEWPCKFDGSPEVGRNLMDSSPIQIDDEVGATVNECTFPCGPSVTEDDDEVTELKIRAFLDEKATDLKKLQTPLYKEFYSTLSGIDTPVVNGALQGENVAKKMNLPPKSRSPSRLPSTRLSTAATSISPHTHTKHANNVRDRTLKEIQPSQIGEFNELLHDEQQNSSIPSFSDRQRKWKEELDEELERTREMMRQAGVGAKTSPKDLIVNRQRERLRFAFPGR